MNTKSINKKLENMTGTQLKNILEKLEIEYSNMIYIIKLNYQNIFKNMKDYIVWLNLYPVNILKN